MKSCTFITQVFHLYTVWIRTLIEHLFEGKKSTETFEEDWKGSKWNENVLINTFVQ